MSTNTEIIEAKPAAIASAGQVPANSPMGMMMAAIQQGASLEQISQMMDLQERWQKAEAKKAYDAAFSAFKAESVKVIRSKDVKDGPLRGKSYAELHDWVNAVTPALSKHGLSSSWKLTKDEKDWIEVTCYLRHIGGHEESVSMGGPPDTGGAKNAIQARASAKSYLERYTLKAITGLSEQDDDTDGVAPDDASLRDKCISAVAQASSVEELQKIWDGENAAKLFAANKLDQYAAFSRAWKSKKKMIEQGE